MKHNFGVDVSAGAVLYSIEYFKQLAEAVRGVDSEVVAVAVGLFDRVRERGGTIYFCGNGGSACVCEHAEMDFNKSASEGRTPKFNVVSLAGSFATITAAGNDYNYESVFACQIDGRIGADDILVAISGSGNSPNVVKAVHVANNAGAVTIGLTRDVHNELQEACQCPILVQSEHMGVLEDVFMAIVHVLIYEFVDDFEMKS